MKYIFEHNGTAVDLRKVTSCNFDGVSDFFHVNCGIDRILVESADGNDTALRVHNNFMGKWDLATIENDGRNPIAVVQGGMTSEYWADVKAKWERVKHCINNSIDIRHAYHQYEWPVMTEKETERARNRIGGWDLNYE